MRHPVTVLRHRVLPPLGLIGLIGLSALAGCTSAGAPTGAPTGTRPDPTPASTPLAAYDTTRVAVARSPFCDRISAEALRDALGDAADATHAWEPGERLGARGAPKDVAHEFGCEWTTDEGLAATAWLFAPPVTPARARELLEDVPGCWSTRGESYGNPSAAIRCGDGGTGTTTGRVEVGHRGLFGDAWLSCSLSARATDEPTDLVERAERWCVQVVEAVRVR